MIPVVLLPARVRLGLVGAGALGLRRLAALRTGAGDTLTLFTTDPAFADQSGLAAPTGLPSDQDLGALRLLWVAGVPEPQARILAARARALGVLVNVEDVPELCDFHAVSEIRRGDLLLTISTGGTAPGLAAALRRWLEAWFPAHWAGRVAEIAALRRLWRAEGATMPETARRIDSLLTERGWLPAAPTAKDDPHA
ncbi:bifunctional precorrin-2 dehydrogenase/sirohydrochlorin ferrochelatase [Acidocella sp.]|uniref:precorrin-2 dehydrogenase/sirohydrochlorin ferrochelatase family protein n=1 Tax=Acidocella sp. TaxID=50710 RepID=UPI00260219A3|nr:NAD(P)-dependent oxidoreductase [Acidocella sp.]